MSLKQIEIIHADIFVHLQCSYCRQYSSERELLSPKGNRTMEGSRCAHGSEEISISRS